MKRSTITYGPYLIRWTCPNCGHHVPYAFGLRLCNECGMACCTLKTSRREVTVKRSWWRKPLRFWQVAR